MSMLHGSQHDVPRSIQVDPNLIGYVACLQEVQKAWDDVTGGATMASGAFSPALIASLAKLLCQILHHQDGPYFAASKMQVGAGHAPPYTLVI